MKWRKKSRRINDYLIFDYGISVLLTRRSCTLLLLAGVDKIMDYHSDSVVDTQPSFLPTIIFFIDFISILSENRNTLV